jgi:hypothetical protein
MLKLATFFPLISAMLTVSWFSAAISEERGFQLPMATEVFQLRSACARLGEQLLEDNAVGAALTKEQVSHYNSQSNRCFVELTVHMADLSRYDDYVNRTLYDGQTKQLLAFARIEKAKKVGMIFDNQHVADPMKNLGWDDASAFIDQMMADDRTK